jgi:hypothetical protein
VRCCLGHRWWGMPHAMRLCSWRGAEG